MEIEVTIQAITPFLNDERRFRAAFDCMDQARQEKIKNAVQKADQCRMLAAGCLLLEQLSKMGKALNAVTILKNEHGKPYIKELPGFYYNLSHSGEYAVCAVSRCPVGIDIERLRFTNEDEWSRMDRLAKKIMTEKEYAGYMETEKAHRPFLFTEIWTKKESASKLKGQGMTLPFDQIDTDDPGIFYRVRKKGNYNICVAAEENQPCIWRKQMVTS